MKRVRRRNPRLREIDREMTEGLRSARSVTDALAIRQEAARRRRDVMAGRPETIPGTVDVFRFEMPEIHMPDLGGMAESMRIFSEAIRSITWTVSLTGPQETEAEKAAKLRAREFLLAHLNEEQRGTFEQFQYFIVTNKVSGRRWRIRTTATVYNVDALNPDGSVLNTFCGVPGGKKLPDGDIWLAQKMLLETDEAGFLLVANRREVMSHGFRVAAL